MRVAFLELRDRYLLELDVPVERVVARPRYDDENIPWNDRLAQTFRERVRVAFLDAGSPMLREAVLKIGVSSPLQLGLLHVEKVVSDALVDVGVLRGDRIGDVSRIEVYRRQNRTEDDLQVVVVESPGGPTLEREFHAIASERRPPTPAIDFTFEGMSEDPDSYAKNLAEIAFNAEELGQLQVMAEMIQRLDRPGWRDAARRFSLSVTTQTYDHLVDLDNAALFVLDLLAVRLEEFGFNTPLDQLVGRIHVVHEHGPDGYRARLSLRRPG